MDSNREELRAKLMEKFGKRLDEVMGTPTVTMSDIAMVRRPVLCPVELRAHVSF